MSDALEKLFFTISLLDKITFLQPMEYVNRSKRCNSRAEKFSILGKLLLDELCDSGLTLDLAGALLQEFRPQLVISVKK